MSRTTRITAVAGSLSPRNSCPLSKESVMRVTYRSFLASLAIVAVLQGSNRAHAVVINIANGKPVIGGSVAYANKNFDSNVGDFNTENVTDGQGAVGNNDTGVLIENAADDSYWLGADQATTGYFVIDLGAAYTIGEIVLFNTSNGANQERGTGNFTVKASTSITNINATLGDDLSGTIVTLVNNSLAAEANPPNTVTPQSFLSADTTTAYRYIRFDATSVNTIGADNGVGLAEIRIFAIPEPTSISLLLLGFCGIATAQRMSKRRRLA